MRAAAAALALLALAGCEREPSFDERYGAASKAVLASGAALDRDLQAREQWRAAEDAAAAQASAAVAPSPSSAPPPPAK